MTRDRVILEGHQVSSCKGTPDFGVVNVAIVRQTGGARGGVVVKDTFLQGVIDGRLLGDSPFQPSRSFKAILTPPPFCSFRGELMFPVVLAVGLQQPFLVPFEVDPFPFTDFEVSSVMGPVFGSGQGSVGIGVQGLGAREVDLGSYQEMFVALRGGVAGFPGSFYQVFNGHVIHLRSSIRVAILVALYESGHDVFHV